MNDVDMAVAVVTGKHTFDIPGFQQMFSSMSNMEFYLQDLENFVADVGKYNDKYDVVLFYNFHQHTPVADERDGAMILNSINKLAENGQGIFVLHHAILAFPNWEIWSQIVGITDRRFGYHGNQTIQTDLMDDSHPITYGLKSWEMVDETYTMNEVGDDSQPLLAIDHVNSMHTVGWTRHYGNGRVFCYQSGHDNQSFYNPNFRTVVFRGIQWLANRI
jgi:type 1 glutamine amidotransferase